MLDIGVNPLKTESIELEDINLLVGKNASGKSTLAQQLYGFALMLKGNFLRLGRFHIELESTDKSVYKYTCDVTVTKSGITIFETLFQNENILIERKNTEAKIFSVSFGVPITINPPNNKLVHQVRRDEKDHPYLEEIVKWAENVHSFKFGHIHSTSFLKPFDSKGEVVINAENLTSINEKDLNKILGDLTDETKLKIKEEFNSLGYNIQLLSVRQLGNQNAIYVKENELPFEILQQALSQGMYRSLFLLIFIHHLIEKEHAKMIIIDDLCEGLDYDRATKLGKLLFSRMEENKIQFVATSNDYFLMNVVDVKYWNIVHREGNQIKVHNYSNSKEKFDKFRVSGLNNFDLFSSNFLD